MKKLIYFYLMIIIYSCQENKSSVTHHTFSNTEIDSKVKHKNKKFSNYNVQILLPDAYRITSAEDPTKILNKNWFDLYKKGSHYYLRKLKYKINKGIDECTGLKTKEIETPNYSILFIDYKFLSNGRVAHLIPSKKILHPNDKIILNYYGVKYKIRCTADSSISGSNKSFNSYKNYKLYIKVNNQEELLFSQSNFNESETEIEFVGDIDGDYKLDFILNSPTIYEENRKILILSSQADKNKLLKKVAECSVQHDC